MSAWLKDDGFSRTDIGLFGLVFAMYTFNFAWSPLVDRLSLPIFKRLGRRKSWVFAMQLLLVVFCLIISQLQLSTQIWWLALLGVAIATSSATQDIAIDGYRIDSMGNDKAAMTASSSMATAGWWTGYGGLGAIPFFLADLPGWSWPQVYLVLAGIMSLLALITLCVNEPPLIQRTSENNTESMPLWFVNTLIKPFADFFARNGIKIGLTILLFIFSFKIGEAFVGRMSIVFYKELGFSNSDIGAYSKLINWWVTIVFAIIGGAFTIRFGIYKGLVVAGIAMAASNLMFSVMAQVGPDPSWFIAAVVIDGFTAAWSTVAMVAFISLLCNHTFSASQYALMASVSSFGRTALSGASGWLVDIMNGNWTLFFLITALMVIPALMLLRHLKSKLPLLNN
ncbi:MFS transporter [Alteromonas sp. 5E99-2]|uniref:MFS transporter n=1 Tax=Alteromonas sp. 5E99-2 TaxID=2817683 RepID=UPI001F610ECF|nr:MFS transporter [Alteromonas sp. 5E99-2]